MHSNPINRGGNSSLLFSLPEPHLTQQCGSVFDGGELTFLEKSRKHTLRMECVGSDGEDELLPSSRTSTNSNKGFKFPKKFVKGDCSTVCPVSVPRKLRSAMKKRSHESDSPPLPVCKKLNHVAGAVELLPKDGCMLSKLKMKQSAAQRCATDGIQWPITKEEEEVAEALFALAGVFSNAVEAEKSGCAGQELGTNSSNLTKDESPLTPIDEMAVRNLEEKVKAASHGDKAPNYLSNPECSAGESTILHCQDGTLQPGISVGKQASFEVGVDIPEANLPSTAFDSDNQHTIQKPTCDSVVSDDWSGLSKTRSKLPNLNKSLVCVKYPTNVLAQTAAACGKAEVQRAICETRNNGSPSRPDLLSTTSCDAQELGIPLQSRIARFANSCSRQSPNLSSGVVAGKDEQISVQPKNPWRRCIAHVYISRFIKVSQVTERKNRSIMLSAEVGTNEAPKQLAHTTAANLTEGRNGMTGGACSDSLSNSAPEEYATEVRNAVLLHKRLIQDQQQASSAYEVYPAQNQSLDFLSLPAGSCHLGTSTGINRSGNGLEISTQLRFPGLLSQNQLPIPFPVSQNCYSSPSFSSHPSVAVVQKVRMPQNVGSTSYSPMFLDATPSSVQQTEQQHQKWLPLLLAHYRSGGVASPIIPNNQTEGPDVPPVFQHVQTLFPPSLSPAELLGARYAPVLQQQQLLSATSLLPPSTGKGQFHQLLLSMKQI